MLGHQLQHVLVARYDHHIGIVPLLGLARHRSNHIVRFKAGELQNGNPHRLQNLPNVGNLLDEVFRCFRTIRLVLGEGFRPERRPQAFKNSGNVIGLIGR